MGRHPQRFRNSVAATSLLLLLATPSALSNRTANHFDDENAVYGQAVWHTNTSASVATTTVELAFDDFAAEERPTEPKDCLNHYYVISVCFCFGSSFCFVVLFPSFTARY